MGTGRVGVVEEEDPLPLYQPSLNFERIWPAVVPFDPACPRTRSKCIDEDLAQVLDHPDDRPQGMGSLAVPQRRNDRDLVPACRRDTLTVTSEEHRDQPGQADPLTMRRLRSVVPLVLLQRFVDL